MWPFSQHEHVFTDLGREFMMNRTYTQFIVGPPQPLQDLPVTVVTQRCVCGKYRQQQLDGWVGGKHFVDAGKAIW